jgi:hypothetical protein
MVFSSPDNLSRSQQLIHLSTQCEIISLSILRPISLSTLGQISLSSLGQLIILSTIGQIISTLE